MSRVSVSVVRSAADADALRGAWARLVETSGAGPLMHPDHLLTWWHHLGSGRLAIVVVREGGHVVALAPLHERRVGPLRVVRWLGHGLGTVAHVLVEPGHEDLAPRVWDALSGPLRLWELVETRGGSPGTPEAGRGPGPGRRTTVDSRDVCPVADLTGGLDGFRGGPGKGDFRRLNRRWDRILDDAAVTFRGEVAEDLAGFEAQLPDIRRVMDAAEADRERLHLLQPPYEGYVLDYFRTLMADGRGLSVVGYVDDEPLGFQLLLRGRDEVSLWIARHHPDFAHLSPGHLVQREAFRWADAAGVGRVDLLLGESQMKRLWSNDSYATLDVESGHPWSRGPVRALERIAARVREGRG